MKLIEVSIDEANANQAKIDEIQVDPREFAELAV